MLAPGTATGRFRARLRRLFYGHRPAAVAFQAALLALDVTAIAYFVATSFVADAPWMRLADFLLGALFTLEFVGRMARAPATDALPRQYRRRGRPCRHRLAAPLGARRQPRLPARPAHGTAAPVVQRAGPAPEGLRQGA